MVETKTHELTFCANAKKWMEDELAVRPELVFSRVEIEESAKGSRQRRDFTIYDREGCPTICGEVKFPWSPEGSTPFHGKVVADAHSKAAQVNANFFVTWNVNRLVLWQTDKPDKPLYERHIAQFDFVQVRDLEDLNNPFVEQQIRNGLRRFLERASAAVTGKLPLEKRPLDDFFLRVLEAALDRPIAFVRAGITEQYHKDRRFRQSLDRWMREVQGWTLSDDELIQRDNLERAAKFACYVLVNKLVFYKALRKRFKLPSLRMRGNGKAAKLSAAAFQTQINSFFTNAKVATKDYETIFDGDFGDHLPFITAAAVPAWVDLIQQIDQFDFTKINYDVIGPIFERLISPEERHRYGQHYTKPDIVDLINAFCVRDPEAVVLDPACGGGTFLVRAYNRKKYLAEQSSRSLTHQDLINELYGVDISSYATHLTMLNLATRDLVDERNYPLVSTDDFFDVRPGKPIFHVPFGKKGGGGQQSLDLAIPKVDAVVGNPPYVRQEEISKPPTSRVKGKVKLTARSIGQLKAEADKYKKDLRQLIEEEWPGATLSGRSDLHCYFWPHASTFLKDGGYYGFVTSSGWLDTEYGFSLQKFLLDHFAILAIFESAVEPWFTGARVATCATILCKEPDREKREANLVRFVQLRSPLSEILPSGVSEAQRQQAVEALRDRIESITENTTDRHWRVRVVRQEELERQGYREGHVRSDPIHRVQEGRVRSDPIHRVQEGRMNAATMNRSYHGSKWGIPLRAPDLFFEILDRYGDRLVPLGEIAEVRFGVKSGCDKFFFPRDITERCLAEAPDDKAFRAKHGIHRYQTDKVRIVRAGDGSVHLIEAEFLEPEVHNLMEIDSVVVKPENCARSILVCSKLKEKLKGKHVLDYINWGERENFHTGPTCANRESWYALDTTRRGDLLWTKSQQYRHVVPLNSHRLIANCNLYDIFPLDGVRTDLLCGLLNSTFVALSKHLYGRWAGAEGNLKTEVVDVNMMLVPDPREAQPDVVKRIRSALDQMAVRTAPNLAEEFDLADRQELDDAVFELLGERDLAERQQLCEELYREMRHMYRIIRDKELRAIENKKKAKGRHKPSAAQITEEILRELDRSLVRNFPADFLQPSWPTETVMLPAGPARMAKSTELLGEHGIEIEGRYIELRDPQRARFAKTLADIGHHGPQPIPLNPDHCRQAIARYQQYREQLHAELADLAAAKTPDPKLQSRVIKLLESRLGMGRRFDI